jgi:hypothetical protein
MDYDLIRYAALILGVILFYAVLARGLFNVTEPYRVAALEIAEKLTQSSQVADRKKTFLYERLGEVYSNWQAWQLVALMVGTFAVLPFRDTTKIAAGDDTGVPPHLRADYHRFKMYWMVSTVGNSPAAAFLFTTLLIIMVAFFASVSAISGCLAFSRDHHGATT